LYIGRIIRLVFVEYFHRVIDQSGVILKSPRHNTLNRFK
jgi:hypothetical protein